MRVCTCNLCVCVFSRVVVRLRSCCLPLRLLPSPLGSPCTARQGFGLAGRKTPSAANGFYSPEPNLKTAMLLFHSANPLEAPRFQIPIPIHPSPRMPRPTSHLNLPHLILVFGEQAVVSEFYDEVVFTDPYEEMYNTLMQGQKLLPQKKHEHQEHFSTFSDGDTLQRLAAAREWVHNQLRGGWSGRRAVMRCRRRVSRLLLTLLLHRSRVPWCLIISPTPPAPHPPYNSINSKRVM